MHTHLPIPAPPPHTNLMLLKNVIVGPALQPVSVRGAGCSEKFLIRLNVGTSCCLQFASLARGRKNGFRDLRQINWIHFLWRLGRLLFFFYLLSITEVFWETFLPLHSSLSFPTPVNGSKGLSPLDQGKVSDCSHLPSGLQEVSSFPP